jgi:hypothetical protein
MEELEKFQRSYDFVRAPFRLGASILNAVLRRLKVELMNPHRCSATVVPAANSPGLKSYSPL